jgi:hypothetical protein
MGGGLFDDVGIGEIELGHPGTGCPGISGLEGALQGGPEEGLEVFGKGPAVEPCVVPEIGVLDVCGHKVSFPGQLPRSQ